MLCVPEQPSPSLNCEGSREEGHHSHSVLTHTGHVLGTNITWSGVKVGGEQRNRADRASCFYKQTHICLTFPAANQLQKRRAWFSKKYAHHGPFHVHPTKVHQCHSVNANMLLPEEGVHRAFLGKSFLSLANTIRAALHVWQQPFLHRMISTEDLLSPWESFCFLIWGLLFFEYSSIYLQKGWKSKFLLALVLPCSRCTGTDFPLLQ